MKTDERIVLAMSELLRTQGYGSTGIKQVALAADAPIGSIYHHFPGGKREIAAAAMRSTGAAYIQLVPLLLDPHEDLVEGMRAAFVAAAETMAEGFINLCPVGTVIGEVADLEPSLREVGGEVVAGWVDDASAYLVGRGLPAAAARSVTFSLLSALEGAFVLCRALRSVEPLIAAGQAQAAYVAAMLSASPAPIV